MPSYLAQKKVREQIINITQHEWGHLDLKNCGLDSIPIEVFSCPGIVRIDLSNSKFCSDEDKNKITQIPDEISKLVKLNYLNLEGNQISQVNEKIAEINSLKYLNISKNNLTDLPASIANMTSLQELVLDGNPFDLMPPEIISRGIGAIRNFYKELEQKDYLYEVKLIIVGEGRVGKTCIAQALINPDYSLTDMKSTEGININKLVIPARDIEPINNNIKRDFQINIWDFGGQEIYHSTHQFFLTKRSIYMIVTESRKEDRHDDFYYWLSIIKLLGDKSPVVIALNKCDEPIKDLPIKEYKEAFENIIDFFKISLKSEFRDLFNDFKKRIVEIASKLPHIGNPLPKVWVDIRFELDELKTQGKNYISEQEYLDICKRHYRNEVSALYLSEYFHDLGVLLHFQEDIDLKDLVVLNHEWITRGVYKILDDKEVIERKGRFNQADIIRILSGNDHKYKQKELLALMKNNKFDLCFQLPNGDYLIPRLLPVDEIEYEWTSSNQTTKFQYVYKFMPKGLLARLIVKLNNDIDEEKYWRYGVLLNYEGTRAIIRERYFENKITIELNGQYRREYLYAIRKAINEIHKDYNNIQVDEQVACNCDVCSDRNVPFYYLYDVLKRYEFNNISVIRCDISLEEVNVVNLSSSIISETQKTDKIVFCENLNSELFKQLGLQNYIFHPEKDSASVYIQIKSNPKKYGIRDRDYFTDIEIQNASKKYPNYLILEYYCIENYLYHPDNLESLSLPEFNKDKYQRELLEQKNEKKYQIISEYKKCRDSYAEFKTNNEKLVEKKSEDEIINYINSDELEVYFKSFSVKSHFNKKCLEKYNLTPLKLSQTPWFKSRFTSLLKRFAE